MFCLLFVTWALDRTGRRGSKTTQTCDEHWRQNSNFLSPFQVMQFGRIDNNAYTLDFQYPFTAVQAFGVALANVTQRLK